MSFFALLGVTWIFGALLIEDVSDSTTSRVFQYLFAVCNVLQGTFIFIFHCLLDNGVRQEYRRWFEGYSKSSSPPYKSPPEGAIGAAQGPPRSRPSEFDQALLHQRSHRTGSSLAGEAVLGAHTSSVSNSEPRDARASSLGAGSHDLLVDVGKGSSSGEQMISNPAYAAAQASQQQVWAHRLGLDDGCSTTSASGVYGFSSANVQGKYSFHRSGTDTTTCPDSSEQSYMSSDPRSTADYSSSCAAAEGEMEMLTVGDSLRKIDEEGGVLPDAGALRPDNEYLQLDLTRM